MATSIALIEALADVLGMNFSTCVTIFRELRTAGLVSNEGRGKNAAAMTTRDAATYLLALCGAERVQDASDAVGRYSGLLAKTGRQSSGVVVPSPTWKSVRNEFPHLNDLPRGHAFFDALVALVESYMERTPAADVSVSLKGPFPWAGVDIVTQANDRRAVHSIWYSHDGDEDLVRQAALVDETKVRQRRRFVDKGGDMMITNAISQVTLVVIATTLRQ